MKSVGGGCCAFMLHSECGSLIMENGGVCWRMSVFINVEC